VGPPAPPPQQYPLELVDPDLSIALRKILFIRFRRGILPPLKDKAREAVDPSDFFRIALRPHPDSTSPDFQLCVMWN
jgi:hypothetical protein